MGDERATADRARGRRAGGARGIWWSPQFICGAALVATVGIFVLVGPLVWTVDSTRHDFASSLRPPALLGGDWAHPLGTDQFGRDLLARVMAGGITTILITAAGVLGSAVLGTAAGVMSGYAGGITDAVTMRLADVQLAFPAMLLALAVLSGLHYGVLALLVVLVLSGWVQFARLVRSQTLVIRELGYVESARAVGCSGTRIVVRHVVPNIAGTVLVVGTLAAAQMVVLESALSFLGVGVQPPTPSWGDSLNVGLQYLTLAWWIATEPGLVLMAMILGLNLLGDWARDSFNPSIRN